MIVCGVDTSALASQFDAGVSGRVLILDGDGPAYRVAATCKRLDTAIRRYQTEMLTQLYVTKSEFVRVHLTASGSDKAGRYRINAVKPYQGQRKSKDKPSLLEPLREAMANRENWLPEFEGVTMHRLYEADDGMMMDAYQLKENGLIWSDDKDLRLTPYPYWEKSTGVILPSCGDGSLWMSTTKAGNPKLLGHGPMFFWAQMLMGDPADFVQGVLTLDGTKCGAAGAFAKLNSVKSANAAANTVLEAYRAIDQNPLPEGYLLWLLRWEGDSFWNYLQEIDLTPENRRFIDDCVTRDWFQKEEVQCLT